MYYAWYNARIAQRLQLNVCLKHRRDAEGSISSFFTILVSAGGGGARQPPRPQTFFWDTDWVIRGRFFFFLFFPCHIIGFRNVILFGFIDFMYFHWLHLISFL